MKLLLIILTCGLLNMATADAAIEQRTDLGNVTGGKYQKANHVIDTKCTICHSREKIDLALASGINMKKIQIRMEKKGAKLNSNERDVLGIFWQQAKPVSKN